MTLRLYVSRDAGAVAVCADEVAYALEETAASRGTAYVSFDAHRDGPHLARASGQRERGINHPFRPKQVRPCWPFVSKK